jgi:dihydroflavonol-4-reductase
MKIFLTGATGFVGHHVARALAAEGAELRMLVRKSSNLAHLEGIPGDTYLGDLAEPEALRAVLGGCDAVVHVAADYRLWIRDPQAMYRVNVEGTRDLLRLAREAGVPRVVYTSSVATMRFRRDGLIINEDTPVELADMVGHYKRSKFLAEQQAIAAAEDGQQVIILNPTTPIGPNDAKPTPTGRIFVDFLNGKFPAYMDTGLNLVDVAEVARAHVAALSKGQPGHRYILGGENLSLKQILDKMSAMPSSSSGSPAASADVSRAPPWKRCAWAARRCMPAAPTRSRNWASALCLCTRPCVPPSSGSAPTATRRNHDPSRNHRRHARRTETAGARLAA